MRRYLESRWVITAALGVGWGATVFAGRWIDHWALELAAAFVGALFAYQLLILGLTRWLRQRWAIHVATVFGYVALLTGLGVPVPKLARLVALLVMVLLFSEVVWRRSNQ